MASAKGRKGQMCFARKVQETLQKHWPFIIHCWVVADEVGYFWPAKGKFCIP